MGNYALHKSQETFLDRNSKLRLDGAEISSVSLSIDIVTQPNTFSETCHVALKFTRSIFPTGTAKETRLLQKIKHLFTWEHFSCHFWREINSEIY